MGTRIREGARAKDLESLSLSQLIHQEVRVAIETAVHEELRAALGTTPYERSEAARLVAPERSVSSVVTTPEYCEASPRYTAPLAVFTVLRSSAEIELCGRVAVIGENPRHTG